MKKNKFFFILGFIREIFHTTLFTYLALRFLPVNYIWPGQNLAFILMLSSGQLLIPAAYLAILYDDTKFFPLVQLLRLAKILRILMAALVGVLEVVKGGYLNMPLQFLTASGRITLAIFIILFFDLIFLYFLLLFKEEKKIEPKEQDNALGHSVFEETEVKNEWIKGDNDGDPSNR